MSTDARIASLAVALLLVMAGGFWQAYDQRAGQVETQRAGCHRGISGTADAIMVRDVQADSAQTIADDPFQSTRTRRARGHEAVVLRAANRRALARVDAKHGGSLSCERAFPAASLLP